jgi:hypothetical protein
MTAVRLSSAVSPRIFGSGGASSTASEIDQIFIAGQWLRGEMRKIQTLSSDSGVPSEVAVTSALQILNSLFERAVKLGSWSSPHITLSENNEIVFEWWQGRKKITFYFGNGQPEYIKIWGANIDSEMDSGALTDGWTLTSLWLWLYS